MPLATEALTWLMPDMSSLNLRNMAAFKACSGAWSAAKVVSQSDRRAADKQQLCVCVCEEQPLKKKRALVGV
jgi:hypothetical protein